MRPHVSIIIPVHNAEPFLARCLDSAAAQTEPELEIICVDDASTDASAAMLDARAREDKRFRVVHREVNGGESVARNQGVAMAQGEYLAFLDHDDMLEPGACRVLYQAAKEANADICKGRARTIDYEGREHITPLEVNTNIRTISPLYFLGEWWTAIYRTSLIQGHITFAEGYPLGGDVLFQIDALLAATGIKCVDDVVYTNIRSPGSGYSEWLTPEKVRSDVAVCLMILDHLHAAYTENRDPAGYDYAAWRCFNTGIMHWFRCMDEESRRQYCYLACTVKKIHRRNQSLLKTIRRKFPVLLSFFSQYSLDTTKLFHSMNAYTSKYIFIDANYQRIKLLSQLHQTVKNNVHNAAIGDTV